MKITLKKGAASARRALTSSHRSGSSGRALAEPAESAKERFVSDTGATWFLYAYHPTDATILKAHSAKGPISFDVNGGGAGGAPSAPALIWIHAACMLIGWGVLLPWGASIASCCKGATLKFRGKPLWFSAHTLLQPIGWLFQIIGFIIIVVYKGETQVSFLLSDLQFTRFKRFPKTGVPKVHCTEYVYLLFSFFFVQMFKCSNY